MKRIPLRDRSGSVVEHALVDDADYERLAQFRWEHRRDGQAGSVNRLQYFSDGSQREIVLAREVFGLDADDPRLVDHVDRDPLNNQRSNLRAVPGHAENMQNKGSYAGTSSSYRGVSWHRGQCKWVARCRLGGRLHWLGSFDDELEAARAASEWRSQHMPYAIEEQAA